MIRLPFVAKIGPNIEYTLEGFAVTPYFQ